MTHVTLFDVFDVLFSFSSTYLGCFLYTVPSTATVVSRCSCLLLVRMRLATVARAAAQRRAEREEMVSQHTRTTRASTSPQRSPSWVRMFSAFSKLRSSLREHEGAAFTLEKPTPGPFFQKATPRVLTPRYRR